MLKLRDLRKKSGLTMKELGAKFGMAESTISQYETGKRQADYETLLNFSNFFGVSVDYILTGKEVQEEPTPASGGGLNQDEQLLMNLVEQLTPDQQRFLVAWLKTALSQEP